MEYISVLIPTYNASNYIKELINALYKQRLEETQRLEIIVIDSSSTDSTINIIKGNYPDVIIKVIGNEEFDHGGTRNLLASMAKGDFLLFMTQDAIPYNEYLIQNLISPLRAENIVISYARQVPKKDANPLEKFARNFNYPEKGVIKEKVSLNDLGIKTFFNSNVCSMYKRNVFQQYGGFPEKIILNEDMVLASKVILDNFSVSYTANAIVYHSHNYNLKQQFKRYFDIGMAFEQTSYLLKHASNEKEGFKMVLNQIKYLLSCKKYILIPYALIETIIKYFGYLLGKKHSNLPLNFKRKFSAYMK